MAAAIKMIRDASPLFDEVKARHLVEFLEWADRRLIGYRMGRSGRKAIQLLEDGGGDLVIKWLEDLERQATDRGYSVQAHRALSRPSPLTWSDQRSAAAQYVRDLAKEGKALLLHVNEHVHLGGADLIWIDLNAGRVVFTDVKSSVSGTVFGSSTTLQNRITENLDHARTLIRESTTLSKKEKGALLKSLEDGNFDVQLVLAGTARESGRLAANLLRDVRQKYPKAQFRDTHFLD